MSSAPYDPLAAFPIGAPASWRADPVQGELERYWDGLHWTEQTRPRQASEDLVEAARLHAAAGVDGGSRTLSWVVQGFLGLTSLYAAALLLYTIVVFNALSVWRLQPTPASQGELGSYLLLSTLATWVDMGLRAITGILFLVWLGMRYTDARVDTRLLRRTTGTAIVSWFVPIINLWWPAQAVKDLWHASRPDSSRLGAIAARLPIPQVFFVWWPAYLFSGAGSTGAMAVFADPSYDSRYLGWATVSTGVQQLATLISAWALIVIITQIEDHLVATDPLASPTYPH